MSRVLFSTLLATVALAAPTTLPARAQGTNPVLGQIMFHAGTFCPVGWARTQGQRLSISQNTALFSLIGTNYGGDGQTTFALPALKPIESVQGTPLIACIALQGVFPPRP